MWQITLPGKTAAQKVLSNKSLTLKLGVAAAVVLVFATGYAVFKLTGKRDLSVGVQAIESGDYRQAVDRLKPLAERGHAEAQNKLGDLYLRGQGVPRSAADAATWYQKAAEQNHPEAQYSLASMYAYGLGVPQDYAKAAEWSQKAVANGYGKTTQTAPPASASAATAADAPPKTEETAQPKTEKPKEKPKGKQ